MGGAISDANLGFVAKLKLDLGYNNNLITDTTKKAASQSAPAKDGIIFEATKESLAAQMGVDPNQIQDWHLVKREDGTFYFAVEVVQDNGFVKVYTADASLAEGGVSEELLLNLGYITEDEFNAHLEQSVFAYNDQHAQDNKKSTKRLMGRFKNRRHNANVESSRKDANAGGVFTVDLQKLEQNFGQAVIDLIGKLGFDLNFLGGFSLSSDLKGMSAEEIRQHVADAWKAIESEWASLREWAVSTDNKTFIEIMDNIESTVEKIISGKGPFSDSGSSFGFGRKITRAFAHATKGINLAAANNQFSFKGLTSTVKSVFTPDFGSSKSNTVINLTEIDDTKIDTVTLESDVKQAAGDEWLTTDGSFSVTWNSMITRGFGPRLLVPTTVKKEELPAPIAVMKCFLEAEFSCDTQHCRNLQLGFDEQ